MDFSALTRVCRIPRINTRHVVSCVFVYNWLLGEITAFILKALREFCYKIKYRLTVNKCVKLNKTINNSIISFKMQV